MTMVDLSELDYLKSIWAALRRMEEILVQPLPAPLVNVAPPDLSALDDLLQAIVTLPRGASTDDILAGMQAIAESLRLPEEKAENEAMTAIAEALEKLDFRLKGVATGRTGGGSTQVQAMRADSSWGPLSLGPNGELIVSGTSFPSSIEIANDVGNPLPVRQYGASTGAVTRVAASITVVSILGANASRSQGIVYNESTARLYVKFGAGAALNDYTVPVEAGGYYEFPVRYLGAVTGIWDAANGAAQVTEF